MAAQGWALLLGGSEPMAAQGWALLLGGSEPTAAGRE